MQWACVQGSNPIQESHMLQSSSESFAISKGQTTSAFGILKIVILLLLDTLMLTMQVILLIERVPQDQAYWHSSSFPKRSCGKEEHCANSLSNWGSNSWYLYQGLEQGSIYQSQSASGNDPLHLSDPNVCKFPLYWLDLSAFIEFGNLGLACLTSKLLLFGAWVLRMLCLILLWSAWVYLYVDVLIVKWESPFACYSFKPYINTMIAS